MQELPYLDILQCTVTDVDVPFFSATATKIHNIERGLIGFLSFQTLQKLYGVPCLELQPEEIAYL